MTGGNSMKRLRFSPIILAVALAHAGTQALAKGLDEIKPSPKAAEIEAADKNAEAPAAPAVDGLGPKVAPAPSPAPQNIEAHKEPQGEPVEEKPAPEPPSRAERFFTDNIEIGTAVHFVWASRPGSSWNSSGSGRQGSSDLFVNCNIPNETIGLRKSKNLKFKGTFRYSPVAVAGTLDGLPFRGVWEGYLGGVEGRLKTPWAKGMTAIAGVEAGLVFVYLEPTDEFETPKSAEANGGIVALHAGADWEIAPKISVGPKVYTSFGGFQLVQIGVGGTFAF